jgi:tetratricopeptide (TPR) repeat protein
LQKELEKGGLAEDSKRNILKKIAFCHLRIGDCECWQDKFTEALNEYYQSLELRKEFDDIEYSRDLAEIYFLIGNTIIYENKDGCHMDAVKNYKLSIDILERNLERHFTGKGLKLPFCEVPTLPINLCVKLNSIGRPQGNQKGPGKASFIRRRCVQGNQGRSRFDLRKSRVCVRRHCCQ